MNKKILTVTLNPAIDKTAFIPNFETNKVNRATNYYDFAGGKGINVASLLSDYGFDVTATGFLGKNNIYLFENLFEKKNIKDKFIRVKSKTRTTVKIINEEDCETTNINFQSSGPKEEKIEELLIYLKENAKNFEWVVLAGSVPNTLDDDIYLKIINLIKPLGVKIALDTSGEPLRLAIENDNGIDLVKPNIYELNDILDKEVNDLSQAKIEINRLNSKGIDTVIISMGENGSLFYKDNKTILAKPIKPQKVLSTVGAGDAMVAGAITAIENGKDLEGCAKLGTAFATTVLDRVESNLPSIEKIKELYDEVSIVEV